MDIRPLTYGISILPNSTAAETYRVQSQLFQIPSINHNPPARKLHRPKKRLSHTRLPSPCPPYDADLLARLDLERNPLEDQREFGSILELDVLK